MTELKEGNWLYDAFGGFSKTEETLVDLADAAAWRIEIDRRVAAGEVPGDVVIDLVATQIGRPPITKCEHGLARTEVCRDCYEDLTKHK